MCFAWACTNWGIVEVARPNHLYQQRYRSTWCMAIPLVKTKPSTMGDTLAKDWPTSIQSAEPFPAENLGTFRTAWICARGETYLRVQDTGVCDIERRHVEFFE